MMLQPNSHNILTELQSSVLNAVFSTDLGRERFSLVGGTALAEFYAGHRLSKDLDIFGMDVSDVDDMTSMFEDLVVKNVANVNIQITRRAPSFRRFEVTTKSELPLQVDFSVIGLPLISPITRVAGTNVLSVEDLAVGKVLALCDRIEVRDGIDLWMLDHIGVDVEAARKNALVKDSGLANAPLTCVDSLARLRKVVAKLQWPHMFIELTSDQLEVFLDDLADRYLRAIREEIP